MMLNCVARFPDRWLSMFDFFFKRSKPVAKPPSIAPPAPATVRAPAVANHRQLALEQAAALGADESAAVAFILSCSVAEARLLAAQNIHGRAALEQVQKATRETDRRVARLMQQRLEALTLQVTSRQRALDLLGQAQALCEEPALRANQVVELERKWQAIDVPPVDVESEFADARAHLGQRLQAQAMLQRAVLDCSNALREALGNSGAEAGKEAGTEAGTESTAIDRVASTADQTLEAAREDRELPNLPRQLLPELLRLREQLQRLRDAQAARLAAITAQEQAPPLPPRSSLPKEIPDAVAPVDDAAQRLQYTTAFQQLQAALGEGALQRAIEQDRLLRAPDLDALKLPASQQSALNTARAELARLQGWAKWGGTVSRDELLAVVETLPQQDLPIAELAKKVGSMRERWRALDVSAGSAPRALWLRFDAACTAAYAPVAAHFATLSLKRTEQAAHAQALLDEIATFAQGTVVIGSSVATPDGSPDWRALALFCQRVQQAWQRLGTLERKEKKRLDASFGAAMQPLLAALQAREGRELALREQLIAEVTRLAPESRDAPQRLQTVQARWQQQAKAFGLSRQQEQLLWQQFRSACDAVFAQRKRAGTVADAERKANLEAQQVVLQRDAACRLEAQRQSSALHARLELCQQCEHALLHAADSQEVASRLQAQWAALPALPSVIEQGVRTRFDAAIDALIGADLNYAALLKNNQAPRDALLLRLELAHGIASPPAFLRERLALQVADLQSTFSSGAARSTVEPAGMQLNQLCGLPAIADGVAQLRIARIAGVLLTI